MSWFGIFTFDFSYRVCRFYSDIIAFSFCILAFWKNFEIPIGDFWFHVAVINLDFLIAISLHFDSASPSFRKLLARVTKNPHITTKYSHLFKKPYTVYANSFTNLACLWCFLLHSGPLSLWLLHSCHRAFVVFIIILQLIL